MKRTLAKSLRSLLALLLVGCMLFGLCGAAVAAETSTADRVSALLKDLEDLLDEYGPKVLDEVYTYYDADTAELKAQAKALVAVLEELLASYDVDKEKIQTTIAELEAQLKAEKAAVHAKIDTLKAQVEEMEALVNDAQVTSTNVAIDDLNAAIDDIKAEIAQYEALLCSAEDKLENEIKEMKNTLAKLLDDLANLRTAVAQLKTAIGAAESFTGEDYGEDIESAVAAAKALTKDIYKQVKAVEEHTNAVDESVKTCVALLNGVAHEAKDYAEKQYVLIKASLMETLDKFDVLKELYNEKIEQLKAEIGNVEIDAVLLNMPAKIEAAKATALSLVEDTEGTIKNMYDATKAKAKELAEALEEQYGPIKEQVKEYVDRFYAAYERATTDDYHITKDSYYVAIGDDAAMSESYVDSLAEFLEVEYNNLAQEELSAQEAIELVKENEAEIKKADLITVGFSSAAIMVKALDNSGALDWATYVGAEGAEKIQQVLNELEKELASSSEELAAAIESYAYYCLTYAVHLPELVNEIRTMNPDAVVVIVGMYNELENVAIDFNGENLPMGKCFDYLVKGSSLYGLVYAMLTSNAIFVEIEDADAVNTETVLTPVKLILAYGKGKMLPSEAGHEYIKNQILDALRITREPDGLLGDADDNGVVNIIDAMLVAQYANGLNPENLTRLDLCYLNHDEEVNILDAMLIAQYANEAIDKFPVEE